MEKLLQEEGPGSVTFKFFSQLWLAHGDRQS